MPENTPNTQACQSGEPATRIALQALVDSLQVALKGAKDVLYGPISKFPTGSPSHILTKPYRIYIAEQFPATVGHIPLGRWFDQIDALRSNYRAAKDDLERISERCQVAEARATTLAAEVEGFEKQVSQHAKELNRLGGIVQDVTTQRDSAKREAHDLRLGELAVCCAFCCGEGCFETKGNPPETCIWCSGAGVVSPKLIKGVAYKLLKARDATIEELTKERDTAREQLAAAIKTQLPSNPTNVAESMARARESIRVAELDILTTLSMARNLPGAEVLAVLLDPFAEASTQLSHGIAKVADAVEKGYR